MEGDNGRNLCIDSSFEEERKVGDKLRPERSLLRVMFRLQVNLNVGVPLENRINTTMN